jgi:hypothetical protein
LLVLLYFALRIAMTSVTWITGKGDERHIFSRTTTLRERGDALPCVRLPALNRILLSEIGKVGIARNGGWHLLFTIGQTREGMVTCAMPSSSPADDVHLQDLLSLHGQHESSSFSMPNYFWTRSVWDEKHVNYKEMFFRSRGKIPNWDLPLGKWSGETLKI